MGEKQDRGWWRPDVIIALAIFVVALATFWLTFAIGYTGSSGFRAWVDSATASVGPPAANLLAVVLSGSASALASVLMSWVRRRAEQSNWRGRWRQWRSERYASALYRAAAPARGALAARFAEDSGSASREGAAAESRWRAEVRGLTKVGAEVLYRVLDWRLTYPGDVLRISCGQIVIWSSQLSLHDVSVIDDACSELKAANFLSSADWTKGRTVLSVVLNDRVKGMDVARELKSDIAGWMLKCGYWQ